MGVEPDRLVVHRISVPISRQTPELDNLKIVALSDVHAGAPHIDREKLGRITETVNRMEPEVVLFLGDLVIHGVPGGRFMDPEPAARALGVIQARLAKIAVLGNHDWWFDGPRVRSALEAGGFRVLENDVLRVDRDGGTLWFAGLADLWTRQPDIDGMLSTVPQGDSVLVLTHNPDVFPDIPSRVALTLAGHTHGGQVRMPLIGAPIVPSLYGQRYAAGLIEEQGRRLFVTSGIGTSILPVRFRVPPRWWK